METELFTLGLPALAFLMAASFCAGFIDSMAGGGGLISMPSLLLAGVPPHLALGTNKFMSSCGTSFAFFTYARGKAIVWRVAAIGVAFSLAGSALGSRLTLYLSPETLGKVLILLLPVAALLTFAPVRRFEPDYEPSPRAMYIALPVICTVIGVYDGFFGPGTGSFLLLALHLFLGMNLVKASGTTKVFNLASNLGSLAVFLLNGKVLFAIAIPIAVANITGNLMGARMAIRHGAPVIRKFLLVSLSLLFVSLIWRYYSA